MNRLLLGKVAAMSLKSKLILFLVVHNNYYVPGMFISSQLSYYGLYISLKQNVAALVFRFSTMNRCVKGRGSRKTISVNNQWIFTKFTSVVHYVMP